jgi:hypothetical protein
MKIKVKLSSLNTRGFTHHFIMVLFVLVFAVAGVGYLVASHADPASIMYDSVDPAKIPADAKVVASYVGDQQGYKRAKQRFPNATVISINETPGSNDAADIWGIEPGAKTIAQTIDAIAHGTAHGAYGTQSNLNAVRTGLHSRGVARSSYVLWLSGAGTRTFKSIPEGDDAHQYKYVPGRYDVSTISPTFLSTIKGDSAAAGTTTKPAPKPKLTNLGARVIKDCANKEATGLVRPDTDGRTLLHEYVQTDDIKHPGQKLRDHIYTVTANNVHWANQGYCRKGNHGFVYAPKAKVSGVSGAVKLWQFYNAGTRHHYYATDDNLKSVPNGFGGKQLVAYVSNKPVSSGNNSTRPIFMLYNPHTQSYYYVGTQPEIDDHVNGEGSQGFNPPDKSHPAFYVWNDDSTPK